MKKQPITMKMLKKAKNGDILVKGISIDCPDGLNMTNSGKYLRWIIVKRHGLHWSMYTHFIEKSWNYVTASGDTVMDPGNICNEIECTKEVMDQYYL